MSAALKIPNTHQVHIWKADTAQPGSLALNEKLLSADEIEGLSKFHFQKDRESYILTRALLRTALSTYFPDRKETSWSFQKNAYGKPSLIEEKGQPSLSFNISHSNGKIICAFSSSPLLGVDLEMTQRDLQFLELAKSHFSEAEYQNLISKDPNQLAETFYRYWTLKESYIKAKGLGLSLPLDQFTFDIQNPNSIQIKLHGSLTNDATKWQFHLFEPWPQYQAALAISREETERFQVVFCHSLRKNDLASISLKKSDGS